MRKAPKVRLVEESVINCPRCRRLIPIIDQKIPQHREFDDYGHLTEDYCPAAGLGWLDEYEWPEDES